MKNANCFTIIAHGPELQRIVPTNASVSTVFSGFIDLLYPFNILLACCQSCQRATSKFDAYLAVNHAVICQYPVALQMTCLTT